MWRRHAPAGGTAPPTSCCAFHAATFGLAWPFIDWQSLSFQAGGAKPTTHSHAKAAIVAADRPVTLRFQRDVSRCCIASAPLPVGTTAAQGHGVARRPGAADRNGEYRVTLAEHTLQMSLGGGGSSSRIVVAKAEGVSFAAGVRAGDVLTRVVRLSAADRFRWRSASDRAEHCTGRAAPQRKWRMAWHRACATAFGITRSVRL